MPRFEITGPDGHRYDVTAPEGASDADVLAHVKAEAAKTPAKAEGAKEISAEDRRAWTDASLTQGQPESAKKMAEIEKKYGGHEAFVNQLSPIMEPVGTALATGAVVGGLSAAPLGVASALSQPLVKMTSMGIPVMGEGAGLLEVAKTAGGAVAKNPAVREALKWIAKGALGATGFEAARKATGH